MGKFKNFFRKKIDYNGFLFYADWREEELPADLEKLHAMLSWYENKNGNEDTMFSLYCKCYDVARAARNTTEMVNCAWSLAYRWENGEGCSKNLEKAFRFGIYHFQHKLLKSYNQKTVYEGYKQLIGLQWEDYTASIWHYQEVLDVMLKLVKKERQEGTIYYRGFYYLLALMEFRDCGIEKSKIIYSFLSDLALEGNPYALAMCDGFKTSNSSPAKILRAARAGCYDCVQWLVEYGPDDMREEMKRQLEEMDRFAREWLNRLPEKLTVDCFKYAHSIWRREYVAPERKRVQDMKADMEREHQRNLENRYNQVMEDGGDSASVLQQKQQMRLDYLQELLPQCGTPDANTNKLFRVAIKYLSRISLLETEKNFQENLNKAVNGDVNAIASVYQSYRMRDYAKTKKAEHISNPVLVALQMELIRLYTDQASSGNPKIYMKLWDACARVPGAKKEQKYWAMKAIGADYAPALYAAYLEAGALGLSRSQKMDYLYRAAALGDDSAILELEVLGMEAEAEQHRAEQRRRNAEAEARKARQDKLDWAERDFDLMTGGTGYTMEEKAARGEISTEDYIRHQNFRDKIENA